MEINTDFALPLPPERAYDLLLDLERVTPCMPGAALGAEQEDGSREVSVAVRLGPMKFNYGGSVRVAERDETARRAVLVGDAKEKRGQGSARATITMTVAPEGDGGSRVKSTAVFELTGRAAQTGRGIVEDVARRMVSDMAACLAAKSEAEAAGTPDAAAASGLDPAAGTSAPAAGTSAPAAGTSAPAAGTSDPAVERPAGAAGGGSPSSSASPSARPSTVPPAATPVRGGSLLLSILWQRLRRLLGLGGRAER